MAARWNLEDYQTVEDRLRSFYEKYPDGRIITELVHRSDTQFIFKAYIYRDHNPDTMPWATGYAEEIVGSTPVNKTSAAENCETSAVGRALANANFAPKGARPSREEMEKVQRREARPQPPQQFTEKQKADAAECAGLALASTSLDELRAHWNVAEADGLSNVPLPDGFPFATIRELVVARKAEIEGAAA